MFARVVVYLLVELFNQRAISSEGPCASIVKQLEPGPGGGGKLVFRWVNDTIVAFCACVSSIAASVSMQFKHPPGSTIAPLTLFGRLANLSGYGEGLHGGQWQGFGGKCTSLTHRAFPAPYTLSGSCTARVPVCSITHQPNGTRTGPAAPQPMRQGQYRSRKLDFERTGKLWP